MAVRTPEPAVAGLPVTAAPSRTVRRRLPADLDLWVPAGLFALIVLACFVLPHLVPAFPGPNDGSLSEALQPPLSPGHILGTDALGNDILSRLLNGGQTSLIVGFCTNIIGIVVGGFIGIFAGFKGGLIDATIMRVLDVFMAFPALVLAIVVATYLGPSMPNLIGTLAFVSIPMYARIARAATLKQREHVYISAARVAGQRDLTILFRHIAPNVAPQLLTASLLAFGIIIVVEATLSFLGLGIPPPDPTWGNMISRGQSNLSTDPALVLIPSAMLFLTVMSLNLLGDAARRRWGQA
jgi:peptide/nickel transport system permease protein